MPVVFDPAVKRIILDVTSITATELYSRSCDWLTQGDNAKYGAVFRQVGADDLGSGLSIPPYYFLQGAWRVRPMEADHDLTIEGNIFTENGSSPLVRTLGAFQINARYVVPVQAQTVGIGAPTALENAAATWAHPERVMTSDIPTAVENAQAVWQVMIESGLSAAELMRLMTAFVAGDANNLNSGAPIFKSVDGSKVRIGGTYESGNRSITVRNGI